MTDYTILDTDTSAIELALDSALLDEKLENPRVRDNLLSSGVTVELVSGHRVWVACVANDDPGTHQVEMLAVAIAVGENGPLIRSNGHRVYTMYSLGVQPNILTERGLGNIRKAMMRVTLGLEPEIDLGITNTQKTVYSILNQMEAYEQIAADLDNVL